MPPAKPRKIVSSSSALFGNEDPEFLEALSNVALPATSQLKGPSAVVAEPSSSSDLFGTDDPAFLDALSKTALPGDKQPSPQAVLEHRNLSRVKPQHLPMGHGSRKRSRSPEKDLTPSPSFSFSHSIDVPDAVDVSKVEPAYTDSDIYGASKFHGFGEYMHRKRAKLSIQNTEIEESTDGKRSTLFQGLALHINGKTNPSVQELRKLIVRHGGVFHPYLDRKKMVTHIIASNLTPSKVLEFKTMKVVTPAWLLESIKAGTLLSWRDFALGAATRPDESQGKAKATQSSLSGMIVKDTKAERAVTPPTTNVSPTKDPFNPIPLYTTDPTTREEAARVPSYAAQGANPHAKRKMQDPEWRAAHTAVAPGFIEGFYRNSRLHHLSTWKSELQELVAKAVERVENAAELEAAEGSAEGSVEGGTSMHGIQFRKPTSPRKGKAKAHPENRVIMHCDFDAFFVSAGLVDRPQLRDKPVVVCHSQGGMATSTSEIASASYEARKFGIKNGMSLGQAKKLCPNVCTIPYEFERYKQISLQFYTILMSYADDLQAVSVDEALADVTSTVENAQRAASSTERAHPSPDFAKELAETVRARIRTATGCEMSIGISHNIMLARVATRLAKPAGSFHIQPSQDASNILAPLDIADLRGFGWSTRKKVEAKFGVTTLGELAARPKGALCDALGKKTGETLWNAIRGIDDTKIESDRVRKSVSCEMNYGIRFENNEEAEKVVRDMAAEVSRRLAGIDMCGRLLTLKIMTRDPEAPVEAPKFLGHGICDTTNKSAPLAGPSGRATSDEIVIGECACRLLKGMHLDPKELRGIGLQVQKLERAGEATPGVGQSVLVFKKTADAVKESPRTPPREKSKNIGPVVVVDPPSQDIVLEDLPSSWSDDQHLKPDAADAVLPSFSQVDPSFLEALPADIRAELEREYTRTDSGQPVAGPSRHSTFHAVSSKPPSTKKQDKETPVNLARITHQLAPRSRPSISPTKQLHPLFAKRVPAVTLNVSQTELKLLNIDPEVWTGLPIELQREQLAAYRAANVGTGMAIRASMSTQAKQERILNRWRMRRRSPSVGIRGRRIEIMAQSLELPALKQRGQSKNEELRVSETEDIQAVISQWVQGFEDDGPRQGDVEYFGKFLARCVETDVGAERAVSALKWWRILLRQRWGDVEGSRRTVAVVGNSGPPEPGRDWWNAFWQVKARMDGIMRKRFGGCLSLK